VKGTLGFFLNHIFAAKKLYTWHLKIYWFLVTETINVSAIIHEVPKESSPIPELPDEDEETREQRVIQEQLESLMDSLLERMDKERTEIAKLKVEQAKKIEDGFIKPKSGDSNDMDSVEELMQQNQALQVFKYFYFKSTL